MLFDRLNSEGEIGRVGWGQVSVHEGQGPPNSPTHC